DQDCMEFLLKIKIALMKNSKQLIKLLLLKTLFYFLEAESQEVNDYSAFILTPKPSASLRINGPKILKPSHHFPPQIGNY
ncbi:MAG: hypothetical protein ACUVTX_06820, partial [Bacteroidales bacterium]